MAQVSAPLTSVPARINFRSFLAHPNSNAPGCDLNAANAALKLTDMSPAFLPGVTISLYSRGDYTYGGSPSDPEGNEQLNGFVFATTSGLKSVVCTNVLDPNYLLCEGPLLATQNYNEPARSTFTIPSSHDYIYFSPMQGCDTARDVGDDFRIEGYVYNIDSVLKGATLIQNGTEIALVPNIDPLKVLKPNLPATLKLKLLPNMNIQGSEFLFYGMKITTTQTQTDGSGEITFNINKVPYYFLNDDYGFKFTIRGNTTSGTNVQILQASYRWAFDYKLPAESIDIYQVIKNPILYAPSTTIDLVGGKNADIIVKTYPNADFSGSVVEIRETYDSEVIMSVPVKNSDSGSKGELVFEIDPVPGENIRLNKSYVIVVHLKYHSPDGINVYDYKDYKFVFIHKTRKIKIGIVPIERGYFSSSNVISMRKEDAEYVVNYGSELFKIMYPVHPANYTYEILKPRSLGLAINWPDLIRSTNIDMVRDVQRTVSAVNLFLDLKVLEQVLLEENVFNSKKIDFIVGLFDQSYYDSIGFDSLGMISRLFEPSLGLESFQGAAAVQREAPVTYIHEFGHLFGLMHRKNDHDDGYSNYNFSPDWQTDRGHMGLGVRSLMEDGWGFQNLWNSNSNKPKWIDRSDYIRVFRRFIENNLMESKSTTAYGIKITGIIKDNTYLSLGSQLYENYASNKSQINNYRYTLMIKNSNNVELYSIGIQDSQINTNDNLTIFTASVPLISNSQYFEIFDNYLSKTIHKGNLSYELLISKLYSLSEKSVKNGDVISFVKDYKKTVERFSDQSKCIGEVSRKHLITGNLLDLVNSRLIDSPDDEILVSGRTSFTKLIKKLLDIMYSDINDDLVSNKLAYYCVQNEVNHELKKIEIFTSKKPINKNYIFLIEMLSDNQIFDLRELKEDLLLRNFSKNNLTYKLYLVQRKIFSNAQKLFVENGIGNYDLKVNNLKKYLKNDLVEIESSDIILNE